MRIIFAMLTVVFLVSGCVDLMEAMQAIRMENARKGIEEGEISIYIKATKRLNEKKKKENERMQKLNEAFSGTDNSAPPSQGTGESSNTTNSGSSSSPRY